MSDPRDTAPKAQDGPQDAPEPARARPAGEPIDAADMTDISRVVVAKAKDGDMKAAEVARKTWRWPQQLVARLELPPVTDAASLAQAHGAVIATAAAGKLTTRQALDFSTMLEYRRRAVETFEIEKEIRELHAKRRQTDGGER